MKAFGIVGSSGSGKTTLMEKVIPLISACGLTVSVIKHTHHDVDLDRPGKDSFRHRNAGAAEVLLSSRGRWVLTHELRDAGVPDLHDLLAKLFPCDLVLVEGYKGESIPALEVYRPANGKPPLNPVFGSIVAVATDGTIECKFPRLDLNDVEMIASFILEFASLQERVY